MIFYYFCVFMKAEGFCTVFIADMNSACKNTLVSVWFIEFPYKAQFRLILSKAIALRFSRFCQKFKISNLALFVFLYHLKIIFYGFLWQSSQEFQWKSQKINKKSMICYYFCVFMKTVGFCTVFIADRYSACKNTVVSVWLLSFHRWHQFG